MKLKVILFLVVVLALLLGLWLVLGSPKGTWVCTDGAWVKKGNPATPVPGEGCGNIERPLVLSVYFSSMGGADCRAVTPVSRTVPATTTPAQAALGELFRGPTPEERARGLSSFFSDATRSVLRSVRVENGTAYVDLEDIRTLIPNVSASCGSAEFLSEVENTLTQFPTVRTVRFAILGDPATFYDWIQIGCDRRLGNCDPEPFQAHAL